MNTVNMFSIFSGYFYELPEHDLELMDLGQLPLTKKPPLNCKKCYGRGYTGRNCENYGYLVCQCVRKVIDSSKIKRGEQGL